MDPNRIPDTVFWEMEPGESPVWYGVPEAVPFVRAITRWGKTLMGVPFFVVGLVMSPLTNPLGTLLCGAGVYMLGTPLWNYMKARRTIYVITNARLMVIENLFGQSVSSFPADTIENVERRENPGNIGSLIFHRRETRVAGAEGLDHRMVEESGFFGIHDVSKVWKLIMDLKNQGGVQTRAQLRKSSRSPG